jgi:hypothetical protein
MNMCTTRGGEGEEMRGAAAVDLREERSHGR